MNNQDCSDPYCGSGEDLSAEDLEIVETEAEQRYRAMAGMDQPLAVRAARAQEHRVRLAELREYDASIMISVMAWDLDEAASEALFDRIADAAHELTENVSCAATLATRPADPVPAGDAEEDES